MRAGRIDGSDLPGIDRYEMLVHETVRNGGLWGLYADGFGWALGRDPEGNDAMAVWPSFEAAAACAVELWKASQPRRITLGELLETWVPALEKDSQLVAAFHTPERDAWHVTPAELAEDVRALLRLLRAIETKTADHGRP